MVGQFIIICYLSGPLSDTPIVDYSCTFLCILTFSIQHEAVMHDILPLYF